MANNQYNRKTAARGDDIAESNPLDELARIVGYDPRRLQADSATEPQIDLEAELLRELHGLNEPVALRSEPAAQRVTDGRGDIGPDDARHVSHPEGFSDPAVFEEAHSFSEEMMTTSLEDELLRELQADQDAGSQDEQPAAPNAGNAFGYYDDAVTPESAEPMHDEFASPEVAAVDGFADTEAALDAAEPAGSAEPEPDEGGFSFPSLDELEDDPSFSGSGWATDDSSLASDPQSLEPGWPDYAAAAPKTPSDDGDAQADETAAATDSVEEEAGYAAADLDAGEWSGESEPESPPVDAFPTEDLEVAAPLEDRHPDADEAVLSADTEITAEDTLSIPPLEQGDEAASDVFSSDVSQERDSGANDSAFETQAAAGNPVDDLSRSASSDDVLAEMDRFGASESDFGGDGEQAALHDLADAESEAADQPGDPVADEGSSLDEWLQEATVGADDRVDDTAALAETETTPSLDAPDTPEATWAERDLMPEASESVPSVAEDAGDVSADAEDEPEPEALQETADLAAAPSHIEPPVVPIWLRREAPVAVADDEVAAVTPTLEHGDGKTSAIANPVMPEPNVDERLAFDASALAEHNEAVESTPTLDIPRLPEEEKIAAAPLDDAFDFEAGVESDFMDLLGSNEADGNSTGNSGPEAAETVETPAAFAALSDTGGQATAHFEEADTAAIDYDDLEQALDDSLAAPAAAAVATEASRMPEHPATTMHGSGSRRVAQVGVAAAGVVLLAAVGLFVWDAGSPPQAGSAAPQVIAADKTPVKQKPADPGGKTVPNQNKIVYDRVDGAASTAPAQKELLTTTEQPVDIVQRTLQAEENPVSAGGTQNAGLAQDAAAKDQARLSPEPQTEAEASASTLPRGVEPHFVRTMTVTEDGKLVPAAKQDTSSSRAEAAAVPPKQAPSTTAPAQQVAVASQAGQATTPPKVTAAPLPTLRPDLPPAKASAAPAETTASASRQTAAVAPVQPPAEAAAPDATKAAATNPGGYFIQISSQPTEAGAKASYQNLSKRYASVIGGRGVDIQRADISGKGIYYRVRIAAGDYDEASSLCGRYKAAGGACFVTR